MFLVKKMSDTIVIFQLYIFQYTNSYILRKYWVFPINLMFIEMKKQEMIHTSFEKEKSLLTKNRYFGKLTVNRLAINI